ncbi:hypothetical protein CYQ53_12090 [Enterococcus faecalis]|uniref:hypothetical protein n=1 Tax=Enterococcus faecalis TaxID=1351 RepID=UPI00100E449A|nr:hypothetical protein [Enterococcus faecalis]RXU78373.1 hypothetical protein CYQ53_12090 [Enterococcus faecalis]
MKKQDIEQLRIWSALYCTETNTNFSSLIINEDYIELASFVQKLINIDLIDYEQGKYKLTEKGKYKKKEIERVFDLKGIQRFVVPDFNVLVDSIESNDLYYF